MFGHIEARLKAQGNLPSPPAVAQRIIRLANDPGVQLGAVADTLAKDPGLAAKVLRIANSPLYARRRRSSNLRQALTVLGLNAATTLALSFSLAPMFQKASPKGLDLRRCWRRSLLGAVASRTLGELAGLERTEDLFLAGLLQDIAMLAIDRMSPDFYVGLEAAGHADYCRHEIERLGADHARIGGWLLGQWRLPEHLCRAVAASHGGPAVGESAADDRFERCVALGGEVSDLFAGGDGADTVADLAPTVLDALGLDAVRFGDAIATIVRLLPEVEQLFETRVQDPVAVQSLLDQARELLVVRNLETLTRVAELEAVTGELEARTEALERQSRRDALTGVCSRGHFDVVLEVEFASAVAGRWPLALIMLDLDHFKRINDGHGHPAGDAVLRATAKLLGQCARDTDLVARYGGEEFVLLLPRTDLVAAAAVCGRILKALREQVHEVAHQVIRVSASLGAAALDGRHRFRDAEQLVRAADRALYSAKNGGRDRFVCHDVDLGVVEVGSFHVGGSS